MLVYWFCWLVTGRSPFDPAYLANRPLSTDPFTWSTDINGCHGGSTIPSKALPIEPCKRKPHSCALLFSYDICNSSLTHSDTLTLPILRVQNVPCPFFPQYPTVCHESPPWIAAPQGVDHPNVSNGALLRSKLLVGALMSRGSTRGKKKISKKWRRQDLKSKSKFWKNASRKIGPPFSQKWTRRTLSPSGPKGPPLSSREEVQSTHVTDGLLDCFLDGPSEINLNSWCQEKVH